MLLKKNDPITKKYDVVIVGSGLAGMTAANKLACDGRSVLLLESHNKLGGFATWFRRPSSSGERHIFDISLHGFPYGMVKTCRRYWSKEIADCIEPVPKIRFINPQFDIETDFTKEDYIKILVEKFGLAPELVEAFFKELREMNFYDDTTLKNRDLFDRYFPNRNDVVRFLLEPMAYANGSTLEDEAITFGIVFSNFMNKGAYIFRGGTDKLIGMMRDELLKNGVDIKLQTLVTSILIDNKKVIGVKLENGDDVFSHTVISNSSLHGTIFKLCGEKHFSDSFIKQAREVRVNTSSCQVFMGLKDGESIPHIGELIFHSRTKDFNTNDLLAPKAESQTFSIYYPDMRPDLPPRYAIVSSINARYEDWINLSKQDYEQRKAYLVENALCTLEEILPGIREKIDYTTASTPLTVEKYTHHHFGSSFGTKFEGLEVSKKLTNEIEGLYHSGSVGIIMSGWLGAANYGVIQAHELNLYLDTFKNEEIHV